VHVLADERRVATVLFADLVGFTSLSERRDPEQVKVMLDRCFARLSECVTAYGGRVDKIVGDAMVALFGAPVAHEDDAERAVRAALAMQRELSGQLDGDPGTTNLAVRIGVNTGEVLVGAPSSGGYTATGDVVNVASRLQTAAAPGQIVVGPGTFAATRGTVRYEPLGLIQAKGRDEPVEAWLALEATAPPGSRPRRVRTPLVGREHELNLITEVLATCTTRRRAHLVLLLGDAGVGKSRLAEELAVRASREYAATVLEGRCVPYGEANAWWPLAEALRQACGITSSDTAEESAGRCLAAVTAAMGESVGASEVARVADALLHLMGDEDRLANVDPARVRDEEQRSVQMFLEGLARQRPVLLVISELHWADDVVLEFSDKLLDSLGSLPFLLVATARPELHARWTPRPGRHNRLVLNLDPLDAEAAEQLLCTLLGRQPAAGIRDLLLERSGGNPFFLEELASLLIETGVAGEQPDTGVSGRGRADALQPPELRGELPATLRGLIAARLDGLNGRERGLLEDAAVIGRTGMVEALAALAEARGEDTPSELLHDLVVADLLRTDGAEFSFGSDMVREVAYETLTKAERARRHSTVGLWLSQRSRQLDRESEEVESVAYHFGVAARLLLEVGHVDGVPGDIATLALDALLRAVTRAERRDLSVAAIRFLDDALPLTAGDAGARMRVLLRRARVRAVAGDNTGARADLDQARSEASDRSDQTVLARCLVVEGEIEQREGRFTNAVSTLREAVAAFRRMDDEAGAAEATRRMGMVLLMVNDIDAAENLITEALNSARDLGLRQDEAWALQNLAWIAYTRGQMAPAEERLQESIQTFSEVGDYGGMAWALGLLAWVRFHQGKFAEAEGLATQIQSDLAKGDSWGHAMMGVLMAAIQLWQGATDEAIRQSRLALDEFTALGDQAGRVRALMPLARALVGQGRIVEAMAALDETDEALARSKDPDAEGVTLIGRGWVAAHMGDTHNGPGLARGLARIAEGGLIARIEKDTLLGLLTLQQGRAAEAEAILALATEEADPSDVTAFPDGCRVLALTASDQPARAVELAGLVEEEPRATYHDVAIACIGHALAATRLGQHDQARTAFDRGATLLASTNDRLTTGLLGLARAHAASATGDPAAVDDLGTARAALAGMGVRAEGWEVVFGLATGRGIEDLPSSSRPG
jgi:class 3 adenylate cyclase/tetratricopeptide (TPR) repeat protein